MNSNIHFQTTLRTVAICIAITITSLSNAAYTEVVSFGDSWSDNGNFYSAAGIPQTPYFDGNWSNGSMWVENLAVSLGLAPSAESAQGGKNYAWGGATTLTANTLAQSPASSLSVEQQVQQYLSDVGGLANSTALYTIWGGVNDRSASATVANGNAAATRIASLTKELVSAGAQNILVLNMPFASTYFSAFNSTLDALLTNASGNIMTLDMLALYTNIATNPAAYGLTSSTANCGASYLSPGGSLSPDCGSLFFVDSIGHHSEKGQQIIADAAYTSVVPVPSAIWLFVSAIATVLAGKFRLRMSNEMG